MLKLNTENKIPSSDQHRQQKSKTVINVGSNETVKSNSNVQISSTNLKGSNEKKDLSLFGNRRSVSQPSFVQQPFSGFGILQPMKKTTNNFSNFTSQKGFDEVDSAPRIFPEADSTLSDRKKSFCHECCCNTCTEHAVSFENKTQKNSWLPEVFDDDAMSGQPKQAVHSTTGDDVEIDGRNHQKLQTTV